MQEFTVLKILLQFKWRLCALVGCNCGNLNTVYCSELVPYFPVDNVRVIYTKMFSKREKMTVRVIHKVRVMQLKSKKFQNT
jgi:hypothetical protein